MKLHIIGSSSSGNCYILKASNGEMLMLECGLAYSKIQPAIGFRVDKVAGCLVTHSHGDHCKGIQGVLGAGIWVWATFKEHNAMGTRSHHNAYCIVKNKPFEVGDFDVITFSVEHDTPDPVGFLIRHAECGTVLFLTDSIYSPYTFRGLNNVIVEANYCQKILDERLAAGEDPQFLRDRVIQSHMSIDHCIELLQANDLSEVNNVVLIHLSDRNSHAKQFQQRVADATGKTVSVADAGMILDFNKTPY